MNIQPAKPLALLFFSALLTGAIHQAVFVFGLGADDRNFVYSISELYLYFFLASAFILTVLIYIKQRNFDHVGYAFMLLTTLKMVGAYFLWIPVRAANHPTEKLHFYLVFVLFLAIETLITIRKLLQN